MYFDGPVWKYTPPVAPSPSKGPFSPYVRSRRGSRVGSRLPSLSSHAASAPILPPPMAVVESEPVVLMLPPPKVRSPEFKQAILKWRDMGKPEGLAPIRKKAGYRSVFNPSDEQCAPLSYRSRLRKLEAVKQQEFDAKLRQARSKSMTMEQEKWIEQMKAKIRETGGVETAVQEYDILVLARLPKEFREQSLGLSKSGRKRTVKLQPVATEVRRVSAVVPPTEVPEPTSTTASEPAGSEGVVAAEAPVEAAVEAAAPATPSEAQASEQPEVSSVADTAEATVVADAPEPAASAEAVQPVDDAPQDAGSPETPERHVQLLDDCEGGDGEDGEEEGDADEDGSHDSMSVASDELEAQLQAEIAEKLASSPPIKSPASQAGFFDEDEDNDAP